MIPTVSSSSAASVAASSIKGALTRRRICQLVTARVTTAQQQRHLSLLGGVVAVAGTRTTRQFTQTGTDGAAAAAAVLITCPMSTTALPVNRLLLPSPTVVSTAATTMMTRSSFSSSSSSSSSVPTADPSSTTPYAVVDHSDAYEESIMGRHGRQLALSYDEGIGKDDPPFDPFAMYDEMLELEGYEEEVDDNVEEGEVDELEALEGGSSPVEDVAEKEAVVTDAVVEDDDMDLEGDDESNDEEDDDGSNTKEDEYHPLKPWQKRQYRNDGSLRRRSSEIASLKAGAPTGGLFAIIRLAGIQHKVTKDDMLIVNKLKPVDTYAIGTVHTIKSDDILLMGSSHLTLVGLPGVKGGEVDVMVEEITHDKTLLIFKKRRRKHSRRKNGFRREVTFLRVLDVRMPKEYDDHEHR